MAGPPAPAPFSSSSASPSPTRRSFRLVRRRGGDHMPPSPPSSAVAAPPAVMAPRRSFRVQIRARVRVLPSVAQVPRGAPAPVGRGVRGGVGDGEGSVGCPRGGVRPAFPPEWRAQEVIDDVTCEERLEKMKQREDKNFYMCKVSKDFVIDATFRGNACRFFNHSCKPNCQLEKWQVNGKTRLGVFALQAIDVGEPLTYNYRFKQHFGPTIECLCRTPNCQGKL